MKVDFKEQAVAEPGCEQHHEKLHTATQFGSLMDTFYKTAWGVWTE